MALMDDAELRARTKRTSQKLFHTLKGGSGFETWKRFDKALARELSLFFTGVLYSREVLSQQQRELCAVAALTALHRPNEVRAHIHAALNVAPPGRKWRRSSSRWLRTVACPSSSTRWR